MRNILLLTDFSQASLHAARYAASLTSQVSAFRIILYHSARPAAIAAEVPFAQAYYESGADDSVYRELTELKNELLSLAYSGTIVDIYVDTRPFIEGIKAFIKEESIDLVVMGTSGKGKVERVLMGSNTVAIIRECPVAVMIVPPKAVVEPITSVVFATDLKDVRESTPVHRIKWIAALFKAKLSVVNVSEERASVDADVIREQRDLHDVWTAQGAEYFYVTHKDPAAGIMEFAEAHDVQLVMVIPREKSFFDSFFGRSVSNELAYHTTVPLLVLREKGQSVSA